MLANTQDTYFQILSCQNKQRETLENKQKTMRKYSRKLKHAFCAIKADLKFNCLSVFPSLSL